MRVLHVSHNFPRFPADPAGGFVARLGRAAVEQGARVRVVTPHVAGTAAAETVDGVEVRRFRYGPDSWERIGYQGDVRRSAFAPSALLMAPAFIWSFKRALAAEIAEFRPDVIHAHWWVPGGWIATGQGKIPVVITCHGSDVRILRESGLLRMLAGRVLPKARAITTVSQVMREDLTAAVPGLAQQIRLEVAPLPVELALFERGASIAKVTPPRILFAGNLIPAKGVDILLDAFVQIRKEGIDATLKFLGEGSAKESLQQAAVAKRVADRVEWSGFVPMNQMPDEYGAATIVALPSRGPRGEGMPLSLVEALIGGAAVVATPAGGVPEIIRDGETGRLVPDGDATALAAALRELLTDQGKRDRMVAAGRAEVMGRFAPAPAADRFLTLYREVIGGG